MQENHDLNVCHHENLRVMNCCSFLIFFLLLWVYKVDLYEEWLRAVYKLFVELLLTSAAGCSSNRFT
jgi:hypothetical protein